MASENPTEAHVRTYAERLLAQHGLFGWTVVWDRAKRRAGQTRYIPKEIGLSRALVKLRPLEESLNTVRHEVAHAIVGAGHGHDNYWRQTFIRLGGNGDRCYDGSKLDMESLAKYVAECSNCGQRYYKHRVVDDRARRCGACPKHPVIEFVETATGKPMERPVYVPRRRRRRYAA